jgi:ketosteroid isomerase-like protein
MRSAQEHREKQCREGRTSGWWQPRVATIALAFAVVLFGSLPLLAGGGAAQKQDKKNKNQEPETTGIVSPVPAPDVQAIDTLVSQMLGAWQVGDVDMMHKYYADDVTTISGNWDPPLLGWDNYARAYQSQRARTQGNRLERTNSYTKVSGDTAWCTYQWQYSGQVDGAFATAFGHTTLVLEKRAGNWLIVLNHTSVVAPAEASPATAAPAGPRGSPTPGQLPSGPGA